MMTTREYVLGMAKRGGALLGATVLFASTAMAQGTAAPDARWAPWIGCWQASSRDVASMNVSPGSQTPLPVVCFAPAAGNAAVDLVTVIGTQVNPAERIDAAGTKRAVGREGCAGWETAEFSPNGKRIYLRSEHMCSGDRTRTSTGIMSITPNGEWLDVQGVKVDQNNAVRVAHYGRVPVPSVLGADMKAALERKLDQNTALLAASDSLQIADVVEATKRADPLVVQAWLIERGQGFGMNAKRLAEVADAKVPSHVIDVMVALSYPRAFAINLAQGNGQIVPTEQTRAMAEANGMGNGPMVYLNFDPFYSGYGYYSRYGYGLYGNSYPGYSPWYRPSSVVVVRPNQVPTAQDTRGRMVRGRGYTRPESRQGGGSSEPRSSVGSSDGGSRSSGGSSSSGGSTGGGEPRTAKPRP